MLVVDLARDRVHGIDTKTVYTGAGVKWLPIVGVVYSSPGTGDWKWGDAAVLGNRIYAAGDRRAPQRDAGAGGLPLPSGESDPERGPG